MVSLSCLQRLVARLFPVEDGRVPVEGREQAEGQQEGRVHRGHEKIDQPSADLVERKEFQATLAEKRL